MDLADDVETGIAKEGFNVYHTGHLPKPKLPELKGTLSLESRPQRAEIMDTYYLAPVPQLAYVYTPPPPPVTYYRLHYSRVDTFFHDM